MAIKIGKTYCTVAEQDALYAQGRTTPGNIVTNAPAVTFLVRLALWGSSTSGIKKVYASHGRHQWDGKVCDPVDGSGDWYFLDNTQNGPLEGACWHSRENGAMEVWCVDGAYYI